ncbi:hypothetical protein MMC21_005876 [Puttea exsequens]|nr:hypothetical protein [Puttea exsequens]
MRLCSNRPEGFGPHSHLYSHILTSCFLDTVLVPLCTWLYISVLIILAAIVRRRPNDTTTFRARKSAGEVDALGGPKIGRSKTHLVFTILYYLLLLAQTLMCILEIARLSLAHFGIGLLPFTFVTLLGAAILRFTNGMRGKIAGWRWATLGVWVALAVTNGVKIAEEDKEGAGTRKGTKYPEVDEITDVAVMVGVYAALGALEAFLRP